MNQVVEVLVDDAGRIVIPAALQAQLGLSPGMTLVVESGENGGVRLRPQSESPILVDKGGVWVVRAEPLDDLTDAVEREHERRVSELVRRTGL